MTEIKPAQRIDNGALRMRPGQNSLERALELTNAVPTAGGCQADNLELLAAALERIRVLEQPQNSTKSFSIDGSNNPENDDGFADALEDLADDLETSGVTTDVEWSRSHTSWKISFSAPDQASLDVATKGLKDASVGYNLGKPVVVDGVPAVDG